MPYFVQITKGILGMNIKGQAQKFSFFLVAKNGFHFFFPSIYFFWYGKLRMNLENQNQFIEQIKYLSTYFLSEIINIVNDLMGTFIAIIF